MPEIDGEPETRKAIVGRCGGGGEKAPPHTSHALRQVCPQSTVPDIVTISCSKLLYLGLLKVWWGKSLPHTSHALRQASPQSQAHLLFLVLLQNFCT